MASTAGQRPTHLAAVAGLEVAERLARLERPRPVGERAAGVLDAARIRVRRRQAADGEAEREAARKVVHRDVAVQGFVSCLASTQQEQQQEALGTD